MYKKNLSFDTLSKNGSKTRFCRTHAGWTQLNPKWLDWDFLFVYFSVKGCFLLKKEYESIKAVDFLRKIDII